MLFVFGFFGFHFILPAKKRLCLSLALYLAALIAAVVVGLVVLGVAAVVVCVAVIVVRGLDLVL